MKIPAIVLIVCLSLTASLTFAARSYHAIYDVTGEMVKPNSTQEVYFADPWNRIEKNNIGVGVGPFANWDRSTKWYTGLKIYSVNHRKDGSYHKRGTVVDNVTADSFRAMSDAELEDYAETMYGQLGYVRNGEDRTNGCELWTHPQLGDVCLRDKYLLVYMNSIGMSYTLREVSNNVDSSVFDLPNVEFVAAPDIGQLLSGQPPQQNADPDEMHETDGNAGRPKNMQEAMGLLQGLLGSGWKADEGVPSPAVQQSQSVEQAMQAASDESGN